MNPCLLLSILGQHYTLNLFSVTHAHTHTPSLFTLFLSLSHTLSLFSSLYNTPWTLLASPFQMSNFLPYNFTTQPVSTSPTVSSTNRSHEFSTTTSHAVHTSSSHPATLVFQRPESSSPTLQSTPSSSCLFVPSVPSHHSLTVAEWAGTTRKPTSNYLSFIHCSSIHQLLISLLQIHLYFLVHLYQRVVIGMMYTTISKGWISYMMQHSTLGSSQKTTCL